MTLKPSVTSEPSIINCSGFLVPGMHLLSDVPEPAFLHMAEDWQGNHLHVPVATKPGLFLMLSASVVLPPLSGEEQPHDSVSTSLLHKAGSGGGQTAGAEDGRIQVVGSLRAAALLFLYRGLCSHSSWILA